MNRQVEGKIGRQRIQPDLRHRLPRHLCTRRQTRIDQDTSRNRSNSRIGDSSDGRCDGILSRGIGGRNLHGTARGIRTRQQKEDLVCRLRKSLYGLKQAPRVWNRKIRDFLKSISFDKTYSDPCIYINKTTEIIIAMWVDDLIIFGKDMASINDLKAQLNEEYEMKDLRELKYFLGIQVHRDRERKITHINQSGYNQTILKRYGNWNGKQQTGKYTSLQRRSTHQGDGDRHSDGSTGVSKHGRKSDVRDARYPTRSGANNSADLTILTKAHEDTRKSSKAGTSVSQGNSGRRDHVQRKFRNEAGMLERRKLGRRRRT